MNNHLFENLDRRSFLRLAAFGWFSSFMKIDNIGSLSEGPANSSTPRSAAIPPVLKQMAEVRLVIVVEYCETTVWVKNGETARIYMKTSPTGFELSEAVIQHVRSRHNLLIGRATAQSANRQIGSVLPLDEERTLVIRGRNLLDGLPQAIEVTSIEIRHVIAPIVEGFVRYIALNMKYTPVQLTGGKPITSVVLTGEFGQLMKLDQLFQEATGLQVSVVPWQPREEICPV